MAVTHSSEGFISLKLPQYPYPLNLLLTPFASEMRLKKMFSVDNPEAELRRILQENWAKNMENCAHTEGVNLLVSHLFFMKKGSSEPDEPDDGERSIRQLGGSSVIFSENVPSQIQYVALGHLHRQQEIDTAPCPIVYSGSLLGYSFNEENQQKYVVIVEAKPTEKVTYKRMPIKAGKRLLRESFFDIETAVDWLLANTDALVEITIISDTYLKGEDKRRLNQAHKGIVNIIPKVKKDYLEEKYGVDMVERGGLKVTTTINYDLQKKGEEFVKEVALKNAGEYSVTLRVFDQSGNVGNARVLVRR